MREKDFEKNTSERILYLLMFIKKYDGRLIKSVVRRYGAVMTSETPGDSRAITEGNRPFSNF